MSKSPTAVALGPRPVANCSPGWKTAGVWAVDVAERRPQSARKADAREMSFKAVSLWLEGKGPVNGLLVRQRFGPPKSALAGPRVRAEVLSAGPVRRGVRATVVDQTVKASVRNSIAIACRTTSRRELESRRLIEAFADATRCPGFFKRPHQHPLAAA